MSYKSIENYTYDSQSVNPRQFDITFKYLKEDFVKVHINFYTELNSNLNEFVFLSKTKIEIDSEIVLNDGDNIRISRITAPEPLIDFEDGAALSETNLDIAFTQNLHRIEEAVDNAVSLDQASAFFNGITYVWANELEKSAQMGMKINELGLVRENSKIYFWNGTLWEHWYTNVIEADLQSRIDNSISTLKGLPPSTLDTLAKLGTAINNDPDFHNTITTALAARYTKTDIDSGAFAIANKRLDSWKSNEDVDVQSTSTDLNKLQGIEGDIVNTGSFQTITARKDLNGAVYFGNENGTIGRKSGNGITSISVNRGGRDLYIVSYYPIGLPGMSTLFFCDSNSTITRVAGSTQITAAIVDFEAKFTAPDVGGISVLRITV